MLSEEVIISTLSVLGGIITTLLTVKYKDKVQNKTPPAKDRMEKIFDGYEKIIKQLQLELDRKTQSAAEALEALDLKQQEVDRMRDELVESEHVIQDLQHQLRLLRDQLKDMRKDYHDHPESFDNVD